jgi:hypothetical protein
MRVRPKSSLNNGIFTLVLATAVVDANCCFVFVDRQTPHVVQNPQWQPAAASQINRHPQNNYLPVPVCARRSMRLKLTCVETTHRNLTTTDRERRFQLPPCAISPRSWNCFRRNWPLCIEYFRKPTLLEPGILGLKCGHDLCLATWFLNNKYNVTLQVFSYQGTFGSDKRWGYPRVITKRSERIVFVFASS